MLQISLFARFFGARLPRTRPVDVTTWHRWSRFLPVRLIDGTIWDGSTPLWRRRTAAGWEYQVEPECDADWLDRQI